MVFQVLNEGCIKKLVSQARPSGSCLHTSGSRSHSLLRCSHHPHCAVTLPTVAGMPSSLCPHLAYCGRNAILTVPSPCLLWQEFHPHCALTLPTMAGMPSSLCPHLAYYGRNAFFSFRTVDRILVLFPSRGMSPGLGCRLGSRGMSPGLGCSCFTRVRSGGA